MNFFAERKNYKNGTVLTMKPFRIGWKRIAKNMIRFGWVYVPSNDVNNDLSCVEKVGLFSVVLAFFRLNSIVKDKPIVGILELFFNIISIIRRIVFILIPIIFIISIIYTLTMAYEFVNGWSYLCIFHIVIWALCIALEGLLSRGAAVILKSNDTAVTNAPKRNGNIWTYEPMGDENGIITLTGKNGVQIDYAEIAGINYCGNYYAILQPVKLLDGMKEDEALVFRVSDNNGITNFEIELDDNIINAVFIEYNRLCDEAERNS